MQTRQYDVIVIGGGASGMMAAGTAAMRGKRVLILEKNKTLGRKLSITGGGRCNITNAEDDIHVLLKNYGPAADFLYSPFSQFGVEDTFTFFEKRGLPLVVQARKRAFPHTEKATDVCKALERYLHEGNVDRKFDCGVKRVLHEGGRITGVETARGIFVAGSYIVATGGISHGETGSSGDGFIWLKSLGHKVVPPTPTIVPLAVEEYWVKVLAGVSLSFMKITFFLDGKRVFKEVGKVLFTHFGLSGPLILNAARKVGDLLLAGKVTAEIDAYPDTDLRALDTTILKTLNADKNKTLKTVFKDVIPRGTARGITMLLPDIDFETRVHSITKEERMKIARLLKALPITITGLMGYDRAVIADGGVVLTEIDTKTMRSKRFQNLYITGDLLHINRPTGGFSLQLCWTTGFVAGKNA